MEGAKRTLYNMDFTILDTIAPKASLGIYYSFIQRSLNLLIFTMGIIREGTSKTKRTFLVSYGL